MNSTKYSKTPVVSKKSTKLSHSPHPLKMRGCSLFRTIDLVYRKTALHLKFDPDEPLLGEHFSDFREDWEKVMRMYRVYNCKGLKTLELDFTRCGKLYSQGLKKLGKELRRKHFAGVTEISLKCYQVPEYFSEAIGMCLRQNTRYIRKFSLDQSGSGLLKGIQRNFLKNMLSLQHLNLNLSSLIIENDALQGLAKYIGKYQKALKSYTLNLCLSDIENYAKSALAFSNKPYLQRLIMTFQSQREIKDKDLLAIGAKIHKNLKNLKELNLLFNSCWEISDKGFADLISCICKTPSQKKLQHLSLNFENCYGITDGGLEVLAQNISTMKSIKSLRLNFKGCKRTSSNGRAKIRKTLLAVPNFNMLADR